MFMAFAVGETIRNQATNQEGRIVRVVEIDGSLVYIVAVPASENSGAREALWKPAYVKRKKLEPHKKM